jgi:hypothetical protein
LRLRTGADIDPQRETIAGQHPSRNIVQMYQGQSVFPKRPDGLPRGILGVHTHQRVRARQLKPERKFCL